MMILRKIGVVDAVVTNPGNGYLPKPDVKVVMEEHGQKRMIP